LAQAFAAIAGGKGVGVAMAPSCAFASTAPDAESASALEPNGGAVREQALRDVAQGLRRRLAELDAELAVREDELLLWAARQKQLSADCAAKFALARTRLARSGGCRRSLGVHAAALDGISEDEELHQNLAPPTPDRQVGSSGAGQSEEQRALADLAKMVIAAKASLRQSWERMEAERQHRPGSAQTASDGSRDRSSSDVAVDAAEAPQRQQGPEPDAKLPPFAARCAYASPAARGPVWQQRRMQPMVQQVQQVQSGPLWRGVGDAPRRSARGPGVWPRTSSQQEPSESGSTTPDAASCATSRTLAAQRIRSQEVPGQQASAAQVVRRVRRGSSQEGFCSPPATAPHTRRLRSLQALQASPQASPAARDGVLWSPMRCEFGPPRAEGATKASLHPGCVIYRPRPPAPRSVTRVVVARAELPSSQARSPSPRMRVECWPGRQRAYVQG